MWSQRDVTIAWNGQFNNLRMTWWILSIICVQTSKSCCGVKTAFRNGEEGIRESGSDGQ